MKSLLYLGDVDTASSLQRESKSYKVEILPFHAVDSNANELNSVIYDDGYRFYGVILNIDELAVSDDEISAIAKDILVKTDMRLCIVCAGHTIEEPLIRNMVEMGVQFFMTGVNSVMNAKVIKNILANKTNVAIFLIMMNTFYSVPKAQTPSIYKTCKKHNQQCYFTPYIDDEFVLQKNTQRMFMKMFGFTLDRSDKK